MAVKTTNKKQSGKKAMLAEAPVLLMKKGGVKKMQVGGAYKKEFDKISSKYKPLPNHTGKPAKPKPLPNYTGKKITTKDIYQGKNGTKLMKKGGSTDKNWIQKAVNPKHKGYCTPMSKPTCTPKRAALARTFKAMAKNK